MARPRQEPGAGQTQEVVGEHHDGSLAGTPGTRHLKALISSIFVGSLGEIFPSSLASREARLRNGQDPTQVALLRPRRQENESPSGDCMRLLHYIQMYLHQFLDFRSRTGTNESRLRTRSQFVRIHPMLVGDEGRAFHLLAVSQQTNTPLVFEPWIMLIQDQ